MPPANPTPHWTARLADLAQRHRVPGAVLGIWADGRQVLAAHGVLNAATGVEVTTGSVFQIGSITKPWTATMIMQLAAEGELSLGATVAEVLPGVRLGVADVAGAVTIEHLLTHASGIDGDLFTDTGRGDDCIERYVAGLAHAAQTHPVGQGYSYCNSGFVLLGRIIEVLDGVSWDASLRRRLIEPLGLTRTVTLPEEAIMHRAAAGHRAPPREGELTPTWMLPRSLGPAGLITASASDVLAFARMHLDGGVAQDGTRVLDGRSVASMRQQRAALPGRGTGPDAVGLAWRLHHWGGRPVFGHDGSTVGQSAYLRIEPEAGVAACLLTNAAASQGLYQQLFGEVFESCAGVSLPAEPQPASGADGVRLAARHAGRYERASRRYDIVASDGRLHCVSTTVGELAVATGADSEELDLLPADDSGDNFLCRSGEADPWVSVSFGALADQTPYIYAAGRITLRTG